MNIIKPGLAHELEEIVTLDKCASSVGSGNLDVYSTPSMIALIEKTSFHAIDSYLQKNNTSVGGMVNILHLRPTALGKRVVCKATVTSMVKNKVEFEVEVRERDKIIGKGVHVRFIIDKISFMNNL